MSEAEEVERAGGAFTMSLAIATGKATKPKQFRFLLSQLKMEAPKAVGEQRLKASSIRFSVKRTDESSSPGEFHPQALTEPDGNLSAHPALIAQPRDEFRVTIKRTCGVHAGPLGLTSELPAVDGNESV